MLQEPKICSITLEEISQDECITLPCNHHFKNKAIVEWIFGLFTDKSPNQTYEATCPCCRARHTLDALGDDIKDQILQRAKNDISQTQNSRFIYAQSLITRHLPFLKDTGKLGEFEFQLELAIYSLSSNPKNTTEADLEILKILDLWFPGTYTLSSITSERRKVYISDMLRLELVQMSRRYSIENYISNIKGITEEIFDRYQNNIEYLLGPEDTTLRDMVSDYIRKIQVSMNVSRTNLFRPSVETANATTARNATTSATPTVTRHMLQQRLSTAFTSTPTMTRYMLQQRLSTATTSTPTVTRYMLQQQNDRATMATPTVTRPAPAVQVTQTMAAPLVTRAAPVVAQSTQTIAAPPVTRAAPIVQNTRPILNSSSGQRITAANGQAPRVFESDIRVQNAENLYANVKNNLRKTNGPKP